MRHVKLDKTKTWKLEEIAEQCPAICGLLLSAAQVLVAEKTT